MGHKPCVPLGRSLQRGAYALSLVGVTALSGCSLTGTALLTNRSQARYLYRDDYRGVVSAAECSSTATGYDSNAAVELMRAHFPEGYAIESECDVVTGVEKRKAREFYALGLNSEAVRHEHHIHYRKSLPADRRGDPQQPNVSVAN